ncbi:unnamed protein product [Urochloa decumbens]|uniref:Uncharacterized protein n=1 Tax=Urochloa decumbens TaxID=240449 RepID=A0ABC9D1K4_9POAL
MCLLPSDYRNSTGIRVAGFQRRQAQVRLAVYESRSRPCQWKFHPWVDLIIPPQNDSTYYNPPMHACGCLYWKYLSGNQMLRLDSSTMELSTLALPPGVVMGRHALVYWRDRGWRTLHGLCYTCFHGGRAPLRSKAGIQTRVREVRVIVDGLVVLCLDDPSINVTLNLSTLQVVEETCCRGLAFPYVMPWHLVVLT